MTSPYQNPFEQPSQGAQNPQQPPSHQTGYQQNQYPQQGFPQPGDPGQSAYQQNVPMLQEQAAGSPVGATKSKTVAAILAILLGGLGVHDFYMGRNRRGIAKIALNLVGWLPFMGWFWLVLGVWVIVDFVRILLGHDEMAYDRRGVPLT